MAKSTYFTDTRFLAQLGQVLGDQTDTDSLMSAVIRLFSEQTALQTAFLVRDPETDQLSGQTAPDFVDTDLWIQMAPHLLEQISVLNGPTPIVNLPGDLQHMIATVTPCGSTPICLIPLGYGNIPLGLVLACAATRWRLEQDRLEQDRLEQDRLEREELDCLTVMASQLSLSLANLLLNRAEGRVLSQTSLLLELANLLGAMCSLSETMNLACRAVCTRLGVDCSVMLLEPSNGYLIGHASSNLNREQIGHLRAAPGRSPLFTALEKGYMHVPRLGDLPVAPVWGKSGELAEAGNVAVPVSHGSEHLGVLVLSDRSLRTVSPSFLALCRAVGQQVGLAIHNAQIHDRLAVQAMTDELTGLGNHRRFQDHLSALDRREGQTALILADIDHFKHFNDAYGHQAGDRALQLLGTIMVELVGSHGYVCRYGGEEFGIILGGFSPETAEERAAAICTAIAKQAAPALGVSDMVLTISAGVACYPDHANDKEALIARADLALYEAKTRGRNRVQVFNSRLESFQGDVTYRESHVLPTMNTLSNLVRAKDEHTYRHSLRVAKIAEILARHMQLPDAEVRIIEYGGMLHDIGKLEIDRTILTKPGALSSLEWALIRQHPVWGADLLKSVPLLKQAIPIVRWHHERWDGSGYPDGLKADEIPLAARVVALADSLDAMMYARAYHLPKSWAEALAELRLCAGTQFDPDVVFAFLEMDHTAVLHLLSADTSAFTQPGQAQSPYGHRGADAM